MTFAFIFFLILKGPCSSIPEGSLQQGLEDCPYRIMGPARHYPP